MDRDFEAPDIPEPSREPEVRATPPRSDESRASREHGGIRVHGHLYRTSPAERETMRDIGRFRTVTLADLAHYRYQGNAQLMRQDLRSLRAQGLVQTRTVWAGPKSEKLALVALTKQGKALLEAGGSPRGQALYSGFVKPAEVRHDAAIYRMYHAEKQKIEKAGGHVRRVVLDYELKQKVYSPLAKAKGLAPLDYARRQAEVARQNGLTVIEGKIPLPDLRIEYEGPSGDPARVDLELATEHYHGPALQAKAEAGFKMYAADGSASKLSRVLEDREITAAILSL